MFRRAAAAEWTRPWSLRSTWWALLAAAGMLLFIGAAAATRHDDSGPAPIWQPAQIAIVPGQFAFLLVLVLPMSLGNTGMPALVAISDAMPGRAIVSMVVLDGVGLAASTVVTVMMAWTAAAMVAGGWSLLRRDTI